MAVSAWVDKNGQKMVLLRNPWGKDGGVTLDNNSTDGQITLKWADFVASMAGYSLVK